MASPSSWLQPRWCASTPRRIRCTPTLRSLRTWWLAAARRLPQVFTRRTGMLEALLISNIVLWVIVVVLAAVVVALVRQIGVLHERIAPAGALTQRQGPRI